jgi:outer membrane protein assembly factor BamD (BamD/ComL family)
MLAELGIDRAAAITVTAADAQANEFNEPEEAARSYRSVLTHFPNSRWANIAQERLAEIQHMN